MSRSKVQSRLVVSAAAAILASGLMIAPSNAAPSLVEIGAGAFNAGAGLITFSEFPSNTQNPTYNPSDYGGGAGSPVVTFGGYFLGQSPGSSNPAACPVGAAVSGCVLGSPTGPLALDPNSPVTFITGDAAQPTAPILSGSPLYNGPIAILFSTPQAGVGLIGGYFNSVCSTGITAFDAAGNSLGSVCNSQTGDDFLGLVTSDGSSDISGLLFSLVGDEPAGFDIDNVEFGVGSQVTVPGGGETVPEPMTLSLFGAGLAGAAAIRRRGKKAKA